MQTAGIDVLRLDRVAFGIGVALAGLAGALLAPVFLVFPTNGADHHGEGIRDRGDRRARLDPGRADRRRDARRLIELLGAAFIASPYQNAYGFAPGAARSWCCSRTACSASAAARLMTRGARERSACASASAALQAANDVPSMRRSGRDPRPDRPQRCRQDDAGQPRDRRLRARRRRGAARRREPCAASAMHEIARRGLLRTFQVTRLFGGLTVRENLLTAFYARRACGQRRRRRRRPSA